MKQHWLSLKCGSEGHRGTAFEAGQDARACQERLRRMEEEERQEEMGQEQRESSSQNTDAQQTHMIAKINHIEVDKY